MFDPSRKNHHQPNNSFDLYDETRHETIEATNYNNLWPLRKAPQLDMDHDHHHDEPRWSKNSPHYRNLSPVSRTEAIIKGQKELMEMVRNMPETHYELSLKDLVEHQHRVVNTREENTEEEKKENSSGEKVGGKIVEVKKNGKIYSDGGFYLKVGLPFFGLETKEKKMEKKKKKKESKVSPRPSVSSNKEKEWWKKSSSVYKENDDSATTSSNSNNGSIKSSISSSSNSNSSSRSRRLRSNSIRLEKDGARCWPLFRKLKIKTKK